MTLIKSIKEETFPLGRYGLKEPSFYHRQYNHDIQKPDAPKTGIDQCKRVAAVALPFIGLCKSIAQPLSLAMDGMRGLSSFSSIISSYQAGDNRQIARGFLNTAASAASIAGSIFAHPVGMLITTGHDLALNATH